MLSFLKLVVFSILFNFNSTTPVEETLTVAGNNLVISSNGGEMQFIVSQNNLFFPNLLNNRFENLLMNISFTNAWFNQVSASMLKKNTWELKLADESLLHISTRLSKSSSSGYNEADVQEYYIVWSARQSGKEMCFDLGNASWFSTFQETSGNQSWPLNLTSKVDYFPLNSISADSPFSPSRHLIVEHLFFSSTGYALVLDRQSPLWLSLVPANKSLNQHPKLCIKSDDSKSPYSKSQTNTDANYIRFSLYAGIHLRAVYDALFGGSLGGAFQIIPKPVFKNFDLQLLLYPSWLVTIGKSKYFAASNDFCSEKVITFSNNLTKNGYHFNLILLDSEWQWDVVQPGNRYAIFNHKNFSSPEYLAEMVHKNQQKIGLLVEPYLSIKSWDFKDNQDFFVKNKVTGKEFIVATEGPLKDKALFDVTNAAAVKFMAEKLTRLSQDNGIDYYELTSIQTSFDWQKIQLNKSEEVPGGMSTLFSQRYLTQLSVALNKLSSDKTTTAIVQEGHDTQALSSFIRISPRTSDWSGLRSVIPTVLALSTAGYSFILPDIIGGRIWTPESGVENNKENLHIPEEELFIRWTQTVAFMPAMQFATFPWEYDNSEIAKIVHSIIEKRVHLAQERLPALVNIRRETGAPIVRPLWFDWPKDKRVYSINDQFMHGDSLLVAPVLVKGTTGRTVYLPLGKWQEEFNSGQIHMGPATVWAEAPLNVLPVYSLKVSFGKNLEV